MPTFLAPWFAVAGLAAAAVMVVTHMISRRRRSSRPLPTARFVPRGQQRSATLERRPRDLLSLLLRAGALLAAGVALARPATPTGQRAAVSVTIADVAAAAEPAVVLDTARAIAGDAGVVVVSAESVFVYSPRTLLTESPAQGTGASLTAAMIQALREAARLGAAGHPVRMSIASPFSVESADSATQSIRRLWPARIALVDVAGRPAATARPTVVVRGLPDDPIRATAALLRTGEEGTVVVVRDTLTAADSAAAREGQAVVFWPARGAPAPFMPAATADTLGGVAAADYTFVAPLTRSASYTQPTHRAVERVPLRWIDGAPAAVERPLEAGCVRYVALEVPAAGDLAISRGFLRIAATLTQPCGGQSRDDPLPAAERTLLAGEGPDHALLPRGSARTSRLATAQVLLGFAIMALLLDLVVRRRRA